MVYYQGSWELTETPAIAIVGSREASDDGVKRAARLARELVDRGITVVSGLAKGIDTAAHGAAIARGGSNIADIGTPLGVYYPRAKIGREHVDTPDNHEQIHI